MTEVQDDRSFFIINKKINDDNSKEVEEAETVESGGLLQVSFWVFLVYWLKYWNVMTVTKKLKEYYCDEDEDDGEKGEQNLVVVILWWRIWMLSTKREVKAVMNSRTNELTYINHNFNASHHHWFTINGFNSSSPIWVAIHNSLKKCLKEDDLKNLLRKHQMLLIVTPGNAFNVEEVFSNFFLTVWAEYCFGSNVSLDEYRQVRQNLLSVLNKTFYSHSSTTWIPFWGYLNHFWSYYRYQSEFKSIDRSIITWLYGKKVKNGGKKNENGNVRGLFQRFEKELLNDDRIPDFQTVTDIVIDNAFLSILVYDFVAKIMTDWLIRMSYHGSFVGGVETNENFMDHQLEISFQHAFLYPVRYRKMESDVKLASGDVISSGDIVWVNLVESGLNFSWGPRSCVGQTLFKNAIYPFFKNLFLKENYCLVQPGYNLNLPFYESDFDKDKSDQYVPKLVDFNYSAVWIFKRDWMKTNLKKFTHKNVNYFHILEMYQNPVLMGYITSKFIKEIENRYITNPDDCDSSYISSSSDDEDNDFKKEDSDGSDGSDGSDDSNSNGSDGSDDSDGSDVSDDSSGSDGSSDSETESDNEYDEVIVTPKKKVVLVAVETRGLPLAGAIAYALDIELYIIRNAGGLPGPVNQVEYETYNRGKKTIEMSRDIDLSECVVIFVDDGISTGATTEACIELIEMAGGVLSMILAVINHTVNKDTVSRRAFDSQYGEITHTLFDI